MINKNILTPEGMDNLEKELNELLLKRKVITEKISSAKELGDLSENAEYHAAREEQSFNEGRINEIQYILKTSQIVIKQKGGTTVQLGSQVKMQIGDRYFEYTIVGSNETSIIDNKIAINSPVAQAIMGKKAGENVTVILPSGEKTYTIVDIN